MNDSPILIVGGGIAGLATALGLTRHGRPCRVLERAARFEEVGAGLQLGPNAVKALQHLGAWEAVEASCFMPGAIQVRDGHSGALLQMVDLTRNFERRFGAPYRVIHRADLLAGLLDVAATKTSLALELGSPVTELSLADTTLVTNGRRDSGAAIIGADGIHSVCRQALRDSQDKTNHHHTLYRKLLDREDVPSGLDTTCVTLWMCSGGHIVTYAVSAGRKFNIVVSIEERHPGTSPRLANLAEHPSAILASRGGWLPWSGFDISPDDRWCAGNTVLVGDAAHATLPYLAQGAAMALEDACILSSKLALHGNPAEAFNAFAATRFQRTSRLQLQSRQQGRIYHLGGITAALRNAALRLMPDTMFLDRLAWIYDWQPE